MEKRCVEVFSGGGGAQGQTRALFATIKTIRMFFINTLEALFLILRAKILNIRSPIKIGFLRVKNEENTILPCIKSVVDMFDKIVLIYAECTDNTMDLIYDYISQNNLEEKFIIKKYPYKVFPPHSPNYMSHNYNYENSLAAYYEFGFKICKKLARFRNGFICKIDADQIYIPGAYDLILKHMTFRNYKYVYNSFGGWDGHVIDGKSYFINYGKYKNGRNGIYTDHCIIPCSLAKKVYFTMHINENVAYEVMHPYSFKNRFMNVTSEIMWFHFNKKGAKGDGLNKSLLLKPLNSEQYKLYIKYILPLLKETNSPYKDLDVKFS